MKSTFKLLSFLFCFLGLLSSSTSQSSEIKWMTWEEAMTANEKEPRKMFIDVYTDWCGFCKKMDKTTFQDQEVIDYLNENFYPVKFNAEQKEEITFNDFTYKFTNGGRRGYHQFAQFLVNGKLSYPTFVLMDEDQAKILLSPGYKDADKIMQELEYAAEEAYKEKSFARFKRDQRSK